MLELGARTLVKFLEGMNDCGNVRGIRCKPVLLQIRSIVPVCKKDNQIWPDQGFFLKVADLSHALYVSLPREEDDLVLSNKLQLGQFVYVDKLEASFPVPRVRGITPLPGRRVVDGNPKDLLSTVGIEMFLDDQSLNALKEEGSSSSSALTSDSIKSSSMRESKAISWALMDNDDLGGETYLMSKSRSCNSSIGKMSAQNIYNRKLHKLDTIDNGGDSDAESMISSCSTRSTIKRKSWTIRNRCDIVTDSTSSSEPKPSHKYSATPPRSAIIGKKSAINCSKRFSKPSSREIVNKMDESSMRRKNSERSDIMWDVLSPNLVIHGQEVSRKRNMAFLAAVNGLIEAAAFQRLLKCLSLFSRILSEKEDDPHCVIQKFFTLQDDLAEIKLLGEADQTRKSKAVSCINLALETDLSFRKNMSIEAFGEEDVRQQCDWPEYAELANSLEMESSSWFLKHVQGYLDCVSNEMTSANGNVSNMMYQVKRISDWLDKKCKDDSDRDDVEVRQKIYTILLKHVEMTTIRGRVD